MDFVYVLLITDSKGDVAESKLFNSWEENEAKATFYERVAEEYRQKFGRTVRLHKVSNDPNIDTISDLYGR